jgi:broad specificity phosphatase PhoE
VVEKIYLIRHGETRWSRSGQHTGSTDLPLTDVGELQALRLRPILGAIQFAQVLVSPLQRARRTCELAGLSAQSRIDPNLREWDYGEYEGLTGPQIRATRKDWNVFRDGCPGGESPEQVSARVDETLVALREMQGHVALFSHGHLLRALAVRWIQLPIHCGARLGLYTAALSLLAVEHQGTHEPVIELWNLLPNDATDQGPECLAPC